MATLAELIKAGLTAQAAYLSLADVPYGEAQALEAALANVNLSDANYFFASQATAFTSLASDAYGYTLAHHYPNDLSGFSATLFHEDRSGGEYVLAIRGTEPALIGADIPFADGLGIALSGVAREQLYSLYRYYKSLTTAEGEVVTYSTAEKLMLAGIRTGAYSPLTSTPAYAAVSVEVSGDVGRGDLWNAATGTVRPITITGHSLGGHLAMLLGLMLPDSALTHVYTFNAPGFGGALAEVLTWIGVPASVPQAKFTHVVGEGGLNLAAGLGQIYGEVVQVDIESSGGLAISNHYVTKLTDALSIQALFQALAPATSRSTIEKIMQTAAPTEAATLEAALDAVRAAILGPQYVSDAALRTPIDDRARLHADLDAFLHTDEFALLKGNLAVQALDGFSGQAFANEARNNFGHFVALHMLTPFALIGAQGVQGQKYPALYSAWQADNLISADRDSERAYTDGWLRDRSSLLSWTLHRSARDIAADQAARTQGPYSYDYAQLKGNPDGSDYRFRVSSSNVSSQLNPIKVTFGSDQGESITGGDVFIGDRLYGGGGDDTITGEGGKDYIEGNAADDNLHGGAESDTLLGGEGADKLYGEDDGDVLIGGAGDDRLEGGDGYDVYVVGTAQDTILDADGNGLIRDSAGRAIVGAFIKQGTDYVLAGDSRITAVHGEKLTITLESGASVIVERFSDGDLGIDLIDAPQPVAATRTIQGDLTPEDPIVYDDLGNLVTDGTAAPDRADTLFDSAEADLIQGKGGDDYIKGVRGGADSIQGGSGRDIVDAGSGDDVVEAGSDADIVAGGIGDDRLFADISIDIATAIGAGAGTGTGQKGDWLTGGLGDDQVIAGADNDVLFGGGGEDLLIAGAGDDFINGDDNYIAGTLNWSVTPLGTNPFDVHYQPINIVDDADAVGSHDVIYAGAGDDHASGLLGDDVIYGEGGNDTIAGDDGHDVLIGGDGHDKITGDYGAAFYEGDGSLVEQGNDFLEGGAGSDWLQGEGGGDTLLGDDGADTLFGDADYLAGADHGADFLDGGAGEDRLRGDGDSDTLVGGDGADRLEGDSSVLEGEYHGADVLDGGDGADTLLGQGGVDILIGGADADLLAGDGGGTDAQYDGADTLYGEAGDDELQGGGGGDLLEGGTGADLLWGDGGDDLLLGGEDSDQLNGGADDDTLIGGAGGDLLQGGAGNDRYIIAAADATDSVYADTIDDSQGADVVELQGVDLADLQVGRSSTSGIVSLIWGPSLDQGILLLNGLSSSIRTIVTDSGEISLQELVGTRLNLPVVTSSLQDNGQLLGGASDDALTISHVGTTVAAGRGVDTVQFNTGKGAIVSMRVGDGTDQIVAMRRDPAPPAPPGELPVAPQNVLELAAGFDAAQLQLFKVGAQTYILSLNDLGDGVRFDVAGDGAGGIAAGDQPFDVVRLSDGTTLTWQQILERGIRVLPTATAGDDALTLTPISDVMDGLNGDDFVDGLVGNDVLSGGNGDDTLIGGLGNDQLMAGSGFDTLLGGDGDDRLFTGNRDSTARMEGGEGRDEYFFKFGYENFVDASASDSSRTSNDVYHVTDTGFVGGWDKDTWTIADNGGNDQLKLDSSLVTPTNTVVRSTGTGFKLLSWNLEVEIQNAINAAGNVGAGSIETVAFANGTVWTAAQLRSMSQQTGAGNDTIIAFGSDDVIDGGAGDDSLNGGGGNDSILGGTGRDTIDGGAGQDTLDAGAGGGSLAGDAGDDTYVVHAGDGNVTIGSLTTGDPADHGFDVLQIASNPDAVNVSLATGIAYASGVDTVAVQWNDGSATATIRLTGADSAAVEEIRFADGSSIDVGQFVRSQLAQPTAQDDWLALTSLDDSVDAGAGQDAIYGRVGDDTLYGGDGNDDLDGGDGNNVLEGGAGDDTLNVGGDQRYGTYNNSAYHNTVVFGYGSGRDILFGSGVQNTTVMLGAGVLPSAVSVKWVGAHFDDARAYWPFKEGQLQIALGGGADTLNVVFSEVPWQNTPLKTVRFQDGTSWSVQTLAAMANTATTDSDFLVDGLAVGALSGGDGGDSLYGLGGDDTLEGGAGDDFLWGNDGDDRLIGGRGEDTLTDGDGANTLVYAKGDGRDTIIGGGKVELGAGIAPAEVTITFNQSDLALNFADGGSITFAGVMALSAMPAEVRFADGTVWDRTLLVTKAFAGTAGKDEIVGWNNSNDMIFGADDEDRLDGASGSDTLTGGAGNDTLYPSSPYGLGASDQDVLVGGAGDDFLANGVGSVTYRFDPGFGHDTIAAVAGLSPGPTSTFTAVFGAGIAAGDVQASHSASYGGLVLSLPATGDSIDLQGRLDQLVFADGTTLSRADLEARAVNAVTAAGDLFHGSSGDDSIDALAGNDRVLAGDGEDVILGNIGDDTIDGEAGDDTFIYRRGDGWDHVAGGEGDADVLSLGAGIAPGDVAVTYNPSEADFGRYQLTLGDAASGIVISDVEQVRFQDGSIWTLAFIDALARTLNGTAANDVMDGTDAPDWMFGFAGADQLNGLDGADRLDGGAGADTMRGGAGDDTYIVDDAGDVITENSNRGTDQVFASVNHTLASNVEHLILTGSGNLTATGNSVANVLTGNTGNNTLDGRTGADQMAGGAGDDTYVVDSTSDVVTENANEGIDSVQSSVTWVLGSNVENLALTGTSTIHGTGNALNNVLTGNGMNNTLTSNAGDDRLDGGSGTDTMIGGAGNDTYVVAQTGDVVTENANEGSDTVESSVTWTLGSNLETLVLGSTAVINGTGNGLDNLIVGNVAANTLTGGAGSDTMRGGAGDDTYVVDIAGDGVIENAAEGNDLVQSSVSYVLSANLERLTLTGASPINGTGNALANTLTGNGGANVLDGGEGADAMNGGSGNDTYVVDNAGDTVTESSSSGGTDTVQSSVTFTLGTNVEHLTLTGAAAINGTGNTLANTLIGNAANNTLNGGTGADTLRGGAGDDTYVIDVAGDVVTENAGEGTDTVQSLITYTLGNNVENLALTGTSALSGTGNGLNNTLTGNSGNNTLTGNAGDDWLDGGAGSDQLRGGIGNDTYVVAETGDVVTENANEGTDTVRASIAYTLGNNLENLTLTGTSALNGTGNTLNNALAGNSASNSLTGNAGADTLDGGAGTDTLTGGTGNDTYLLGRGHGVDTVVENDATAGNADIGRFLAGVTHDQVWFLRSGNNLEASIIGTGDKLVVKDWYLGNQYRVEQFNTVDANKTLLASNVQNLVNAMASFAPPAMGQTTLSPQYQAQLASVIAANWQ